ncbi:MAG: hypothetical protein ACK4N5_04005, partial [Myxococcales bacterium]
MAGLLVASCGGADPGALALESPRTALLSSTEELDLAPFLARGRLYSELVQHSEQQAREPVTDGPAWFAVGRDATLQAAALPPGLFAAPPEGVDVVSSAEPWPDDPRASLGGFSE